jgi:hypothetical protein
VKSPALDLVIKDSTAKLPALTTDPSAVGDFLDPSRVTHVLGLNLIATWNGFAANDEVTFYWSGSKTVGRNPPPKTVDYNSGGKVWAHIVKTFLDDNGGGTIDFWYVVRHASGLEETSPTLTLRIGAAALDLPPPTVDQAVGNQLDPFAALNGITVRVPANAALKGSDSVSVTWKDIDDPIGQRGSWQTAAQPGNPSGMTFTVPSAVLAFNFGQQVEVTYTVDRAGQQSVSAMALGTASVATAGESALPPGYATLRADARSAS